MGAVSDALDEEVAARALEVALDEFRMRMTASEPRQLEAELAELDAKIARALDLAIEHGDVAAVKDWLRSLKADRERVAREHAHARMDLPTVEELLPALRGCAVSRRYYSPTWLRGASRSARSSVISGSACTAMVGSRARCGFSPTKNSRLLE